MSDPVIVVEVVSTSKRGIDAGVKLVGYFAIPSLRHYLIVDTDGQTVIHYHRGEDDLIGVRILRDSLLTLDPPGLDVEVRDIFDGL